MNPPDYSTLKDLQFKHEDKYDTISYNKTIHCSACEQRTFISLVILIIILMIIHPYWISVIMLEYMNPIKWMNNTT